jgi:hypothetical protein
VGGRMTWRLPGHVGCGLNVRIAFEFVQIFLGFFSLVVMQSKAEWRIERCDWDHNAPDEQVFSEDENQILPLPLSSHESIGDACIYESQVSGNI